MIRCQLLIFLLAGQVVAANWHHADSEMRLLAKVPREGRSMQVSLPADFSHFRGLRAVTENGAPLPAQPVIVGDKLVAVSVNHSPSFRGGYIAEYVDYEYNGEMRKRRRWLARTAVAHERPMHIYLYFLEAADSAAPAPALDEDEDAEPQGLTPDSPVACSMMSDIMVGRPATGAEYRDLARRGERDRPSLNGDWFSFGDAGAVGINSYKVSRSSKKFMHLHLESTMVVANAKEISINVDNGRRHSAWYLFVDHQPVASWTESPPGDQVVMPPLALEPGIHPVSLFIICRGNESMPRLSFPDDAHFVTPHRSTGLIVEAKESVLTPGVSFATEQRFAFDRTQTELGLFRFSDLSSNLLKGKVTRTRIGMDGYAAEFAEGRAGLIVPLRSSHQLSLTATDDHGFVAKLDLPLAERTDGVKLLDADFDILRLPTLLPDDEQLAFDYSLAWPAEFPPEFIAAARVDIRYRNPAGDEIANVAHAIPASPFKRQLTLEVPESAQFADVALAISGHPIAPVQRIRFAEFADADLAFRASGDRLRIGDDFAVLRPVDGGVSEPTGGAINHVAVVDDFMAIRNHISDDLSVTAWLEQQGLRSSHHVVLGELATSLPHLRKYEYLGELLKSDVDAIVWAVGHEELAHGLHLRPFAAEMRFVVAACLQAGKLPILVSPPAKLEIGAGTLRPYALALKELAVTYGVPIADAYSASLRHEDLGAHQQVDKVHSATLDAAGREWLLAQILRAIRRAGS
jgi:hypothetical protein